MGVKQNVEAGLQFLYGGDTSIIRTWTSGLFTHCSWGLPWYHGKKIEFNYTEKENVIYIRIVTTRHGCYYY